MSEIVEKKKRGRRKKEEIKVEEVTTEVKKRGRKPKGGKLTTKQVEPDSNTTTIVNVILHLKCSLNDLVEINTKAIGAELTYNPEMPPEIQTYNRDEIRGAFSEYESNKQKQESKSNIQKDRHKTNEITNTKKRNRYRKKDNKNEQKRTTCIMNNYKQSDNQTTRNTDNKETHRQKYITRNIKKYMKKHVHIYTYAGKKCMTTVSYIHMHI